MSVDKNRIKYLIDQIIKIEHENQKTKKLNDDQVIEKIKRLVMEEVKKCY